MNVVIALLLGINLAGSSARFRFDARPGSLHFGYTTKPLHQCGSGRSVPLRGPVLFVIHFVPARTALSFARPRRLRGSGHMQELAKVCDFESDLAWAIGLDRSRAFRVSRAGANVTVSFG